MAPVGGVSLLCKRWSAPVHWRCMASIARSHRVQDVFIVGHKRTPLGSFQGCLAGKTAVELGSAAIRGALVSSGVSQNQVEEVYMGCVVQAGLGQAPARQAALGAGLQVSTPATTVNKVCASGMKAISLASSSLALGHRNVVVAGGMESLSNTPYTMARGATPYGGLKLKDSCHVDALTDAYSGWHMGRCAENTASNMSIGRQEQDDYGILSYKRWEEAVEAGAFEGEILPMDVKVGKTNQLVDRDEEPNRCNYETFRSTPTYWGETVGVGSCSKFADGAAAAVLVNEDGLKQLGLEPLARVVGYGDAAVEPVDWPVAPAKGVQELLARHGLTTGDIAAWEINEAFAVVVLANARILEIGTETINRHGGAIAIGHPFGMSGARITNHLVHSLEKGQLGVATLCNGGGGAGSILIERL